MRKLVLFTLFLLAPGWALADNHDTAIVEMWKCTLKDGKTMEEVQAVNKRWLAMTRKVAGSDEVNSYSLQTLVGDLTIFGFADSYPDMATYAKVKAAEDTEEGEAIDAAFEELTECSDNRLYKSTRH
jgi:hypothetical protein